LVARDFATALRARAERLRQFPFLGRAGVLDDTRELIVHRSYILSYRVHAEEAQCFSSGMWPAMCPARGEVANRTSRAPASSGLQISS
jgi:hypothetical protein